MLKISAFLCFVFVFFLIHYTKRLFEQTYLWQIKEYRWDRVKSFIKESRLSLITAYPTVVASILAFFGILLWEFIRKTWLYFVIPIGFGYFVYSSLTTISNIFARRLVKPKKSVRNFIIVGLVFLASFLPLFFCMRYYQNILPEQEETGMLVEPASFEEFFPQETEEGLLVIPLETVITVLFFKCLFILDLILPLLVAFSVAFTSIFSSISRKIKINQAKKKVSQIEDLIVVGITGSYGKTTTKEILHMILKERYKTYSTSGNVNSDIGTAITILENVGRWADVFIVEMGAYKQGEIKAICDIVKPDVAIITSISEQHLALFGSIENTLKAKYEIVEYSKKDACIVLNGDSDLVLRIAGKSDKKEILYSTKHVLDVWASDIKSKEDRIEFNVHYKGENQRFEVRMLGEHNVSNVLAAASAALQLNMSLAEISEALKKGSRERKIGRLSIGKSNYGYRVIDDSYNSNPAGFLASLDYLDNQKAGRKILVTIGIIELGQERKNIYEELSKKIVNVCDVLVTTDEELVKHVKDQNEGFEIIFDKGINKQLDFLRTKVKKNDIVLFEGPNLRLIEEIVKGS